MKTQKFAVCVRKGREGGRRRSGAKMLFHPQTYCLQGQKASIRACKSYITSFQVAPSCLIMLIIAHRGICKIDSILKPHPRISAHSG